ncbi:MAG: glutathione S-transferase family protein [Proteobacteria bacterium]|nr:glutathione S-transferase family protein [Pseudomonadota bacterium]
MSARLYSGPLSLFGAKVEIAAREKGIDFQLVMVPFSQQQGYSPKDPEVLRVNPKRQVPVWVDDAVELYDSTQIIEYLEDRWPTPALWPRALAGRARARLLEHASDEVFFPHVIRLMGMRANPDPVDAPEWRQACAGIESYYARMEQALGTHRHIAGDEYTFADIAFYLAQFFAARHTVPIGGAHVNLRAWRARVAARPAVKQVLDAMASYLRSIDYPVPEYG